MASRYNGGSLPGYGDCAVPEPCEPEKGIDWDRCDWCGKGAWLPTGNPNSKNATVLVETHHIVTCPHTDADANLHACPDCIESGRADTHPHGE